MRQLVAALSTAVVVGGCSIIYNPDNIPKFKDAPITEPLPPPDANPANLTLGSAFPPKIYEGTGQFHSLPAIIELDGTNMTSNATVTFSGSDLTVVTSAVAGDHTVMVVAVDVALDSNCGSGSSKSVDVMVSQPNGMGGSVTAMLTPGVTIECLEELKTSPAPAGGGQFSEIAISGDLSIGSGSGSALLWSASEIMITGNVDVSAAGSAAGLGGGAGGASGGNGTGLSPGLAASSTLLGACAGGGGGGFATKGATGIVTGGVTGGNAGMGGAATGDMWISSYAANSSSGGGGGSGCSAGFGGGGGGTLELTAGGDLSVGNLTANGSAGSANGGTGTGGVIVVRNGAGTMAFGALSAAPGQPGGNGGSGSPGRIRIDSANGAQPPSSSIAVIGPMFENVAASQTVTTTKPTLMLYGTPGDSTSTVKVFNSAGNSVGGTYTPSFGTTNPAIATIGPVTLQEGWNQVCVVVPSGNPGPAHSVGANCLVMGYAPP